MVMGFCTMQVIQSLTNTYTPKNGHGSGNSYEGGVQRVASTVAGSIEAMLSVDLAHPNIVQTFKSTSRPMLVSLLHFLEMQEICEMDRSSISYFVDLSWLTPTMCRAYDVSRTMLVSLIQGTSWAEIWIVLCCTCLWKDCYHASLRACGQPASTRPWHGNLQ